MLDAFIVAYEAAARLTQAIDAKRRQQRGPTHRGWWHVGLVGPIAAAMAAARLLELDAGRTAVAIGIASCSSGGFRRNMGTMAKALHSGSAARAGIEAALLARQGFTADPAIIESPLGFLDAVVLPEERDIAAITQRLGRPYVLEGPLRIKRFPACSPGQPLIEAALRLVHDHAVSPDAIEQITADLHIFSLLRAVPHDAESAGFSGAFLLAATLVHGGFTLDQITEQAVHDPRIATLMQRIRHVPASAGEKEMVTVGLHDGRTVSVEVLPVPRLSARADIRDKFRACAEPVIGPASCAALEEAILSLDRQPDLVRLMAATTVPS